LRGGQGGGGTDVDELAGKPNCAQLAGGGERGEVVSRFAMTLEAGKGGDLRRGTAPDEPAGRPRFLDVDAAYEPALIEDDDVRALRFVRLEDAEDCGCAIAQVLEETHEPLYRLPDRVGQPDQDDLGIVQSSEAERKRLGKRGRLALDDDRPELARVRHDVRFVGPGHDAELAAPGSTHSLDHAIHHR
jgi:hypothetical protein